MDEARSQAKKKRNDVIGISVIVALAFVVALGYQIYANLGQVDQSSGPYVVIQSVDKTIYSDVLSKPEDIEVKNEYGTNLVKIDGKQVWVEQSNCDNQICVHTGKISNPGDMIVCLPHKVLIQVVKSPEDAVPLNG